MLVLKSLRFILEVVFPSLCYICNKPSKDVVCEDCRDSIEHRLLINKVIYPGVPFYKLYSPFLYEMEIRDLIEKFKYQRQRAVVKFFKNYIVNLLDENYDFIIPVPLHPLKEKERGFNQSLLIAELIKEELQVPIVTEGIVRTKYTKTQTKLSRKEREENVKNAFNIKSVKRFIGKKLLIVDDVYTTGSTVRSLAKCFPKEVSRIDVLTLAIARL